MPDGSAAAIATAPASSRRAMTRVKLCESRGSQSMASGSCARMRRPSCPSRPAACSCRPMNHSVIWVRSSRLSPSPRRPRSCSAAFQLRSRSGTPGSGAAVALSCRDSTICPSRIGSAMSGTALPTCSSDTRMSSCERYCAGAWRVASLPGGGDMAYFLVGCGVSCADP